MEAAKNITSAKTSFEIQALARNNAEDFKNTLNDLYSWEKDIKDKEKKMQAMPVEKPIQEPSVRSLIGACSDKQEVKTNAACYKPKITGEIRKKAGAPVFPPTDKWGQANIVKERGNNYVKVKEFEKAVYEYNAAIEIFDKDPIYFSNRALCYLRMEKYQNCIEDCNRAIALDSLCVKAFYRRMQAYESLNSNNEALKDCTSILMIDPKNIEAKKSLDRINQRLRKNVKSVAGPSFSPMRTNTTDILPINKPPYSRSKKPLKRVAITDVIGPKDSKNYENSNIQISDEAIDKLFNSDCGPFVEVKKSPTSVEAVQKPELSSSSVDSNKICTKQRKQTAAPTVEAASQLLLLNSNKPVPPPPTSTAQFYSSWKELSGGHKYQYLKSIDIRMLSKILGAGFDSDTLTDVIKTLHEFYIPKNDAAIAQTLLEISKNNQVAILSLLLSLDDRKILSEILNFIKEKKSNTSVAAVIERNFNFN